MTTHDDVTDLIRRLAAGQADADEALWSTVYEDLRRTAERHLRDEPSGHTLQATALVHEAYLRLNCNALEGVDSRLCFFSVASRAMRRVLIDHARRRRSAKRGGDRARVDEASTLPADDSALSIDSLLDLDLALQKLEAVDSELARLVELRTFGGLTFDETARALGVATITAKRMWKLARGWLHRTLAESKTADSGAGDPGIPDTNSKESPT